MPYVESHHPPPKAIVNFNRGGHPTGAEMVVGGLLIIVGFLVFLTWVATFESIYAVGLLPLVCGFILEFHAEPILPTLRRWRETRPSSHPAR